jgi:hypothetical protein
MKIFAYYFPQFYTIPENDFHWGEGFTDWVNVRNSKPLFEGHYQPRVPLDNNYYDQSLPSVIANQAKIAKKYGVDGFSFYHYWFDGQLVLGKPAENFLEQKDLDLEFCFTWANETWSKRWIGDDTTIIFQQNHTLNTSDWDEHFDYLYKFFIDARYLKKDNKPVFQIYNPALLDKCSEMFSYWDELAKKKGFSGMYYTGIAVSEHSKEGLYDSYDAILDFEPRYVYNNSINKDKSIFSSNFFQRFRNLPEPILNLLTKVRHKATRSEKIQYKEITKLINESQKGIPTNKTRFYGAFVGWDNTPRYNNRSKIYLGATPKEFSIHIEERLNNMEEDSILFINAWNEWSEGAYLEPDEKHGYEYLEALQAVKNKIIG